MIKAEHDGRVKEILPVEGSLFDKVVVVERTSRSLATLGLRRTTYDRYDGISAACVRPGQHVKKGDLLGHPKQGKAGKA